MYHMVETLIGDFEPCQRSGKTTSSTMQAEIPIPHPWKPGEQWVLDITGPFANGFYLGVGYSGAEERVYINDLEVTFDVFGRPANILGLRVLNTSQW